MNQHRTPTRPRRLAAVGLVALVATGVGCSDDSGGPRASDRTTTTMSFTKSVGVARHALDAAGDDSCRLVAANRDAPALGQPATRAEVKRATQLTVDYFSSLASAARTAFPEASDQVLTAATAYGRTMEAAGYSADAYRSTTWATEEVQAAYRTIAAACPAPPSS